MNIEILMNMNGVQHRLSIVSVSRGSSASQRLLTAKRYATLAPAERSQWRLEINHYLTIAKPQKCALLISTLSQIILY